METFKQALSFPLFATAASLVWVFGHQAGFDGVLRLLFGLTLLAMAAWCWGRWVEALREAMAGQPVSVSSTQPYGCAVRY
jgi:thiol:disulfide interchange protein